MLGGVCNISLLNLGICWARVLQWKGQWRFEMVNIGEQLASVEKWGVLHQGAIQRTSRDPGPFCTPKIHKCPTESSNHSAWHVSWVKPRLLVYSTSGCAFAFASAGSVAAGAAAVAAVAAAGGELERPEPSADWTWWDMAREDSWICTNNYVYI